MVRVRRFLPAAVLILGTLLVLNPLYAFPAGVSPDYHYDVQKVDPGDANEVFDAIEASDHAVVCPGRNRVCALETEVHEAGSLAVDSDVVYESYRQWPSYDVLVVNGTYVRPVSETSNGTTVLDHEPVSQAEALELAAHHTERGEVSGRAIRAIESGGTWSDSVIPVLSSRIPVAHDGSYYVGETRQVSSDGIDRPLVWGVRGGGILVGLILLAIGIRATSATRLR